jgi:hypothetical protein
VQFESIASFKRHCNTQAHTHRQLAEQNAAVMDENEWEIDDTAEPIRVVHHPGPRLISEGQEEEEEEEEEESLCFGEETDSQILDGDLEDDVATDDLSKEFFPFPDEKFFLLYCYAHGIMRPKVGKTLDFLVIVSQN